MRLALLALLLSSAALALNITSPSTARYWIQFESNTIQWTVGSGDPSPVNIVVTNPNPNILNGAFSIAQNVPVAAETFTVTNVTLIQGDGYVLSFVNPGNQAQVYATSSPFQVKPPGTPPAPTAVSTAAAGSGSGGTATGSSTASGASASATKKSNAVLGVAMNFPALLYTCSILAFGNFLL